MLNFKVKNKLGDPKALFLERLEQNYADFKAEMVLKGGTKIYDSAEMIIDVEYVYDQLTTYNYLEDYEYKYFLNFYNPLEMIVNFWRDSRNGEKVRSDELLEAICELLTKEDNDESYITMKLAEKMQKKHGVDVNIKKALVKEIIELSEPYLQLLKSSGYDLFDIAFEFLYGDDDFDDFDWDSDDFYEYE